MRSNIAADTGRAVRAAPPPETRSIPAATVYRVRLAPERGVDGTTTLRGTIRIEAAPENPAVRIWRFAGLERLLGHIAAREGVWFARRDEVAHAWRAANGLPRWRPAAR
jgi:hypothetical protein